MNGKKSAMPGMNERLLLRRKVLRFLRTQSLMVLATCGADGRPRASLVTFLIDDDFTVWFATHRQTRKFEDLRENPYVAMSMGFDAGPWTVQMTGRAKMHADGVANFFKKVEASPKALAWMTGDGYPAQPFAAMPGIDVALFGIKVSEVQVLEPDEKKGVRFRRFKP